jgi:hypothetical protein
MKVAILTAVLGNFETSPKDPVLQDLPEGVEVTFHRFTDKDFPPIADLPPRFQYRIPKLFGWQMFPGYDVYIWLDGGMSLQRSDCVKWFLDQLGDCDISLFRHPWRGTVKDEVDHIETKLLEGNKYITSRYKNGLHREQLEEMESGGYEDDDLYATTVFIYRNNERAHQLMNCWWLLQSRYYTCDQVNLPMAIQQIPGLRLKKLPDNLFKIGYVSLVSHHK